MGSNRAQTHDAVEIRGTIVFLVVIAVVILAVWFACFFIYLSRA